MSARHVTRQSSKPTLLAAAFHGITERCVSGYHRTQRFWASPIAALGQLPNGSARATGSHGDSSAAAPGARRELVRDVQRGSPRGVLRCVERKRAVCGRDTRAAPSAALSAYRAVLAGDKGAHKRIDPDSSLKGAARPRWLASAGQGRQALPTQTHMLAGERDTHTSMQEADRGRWMAYPTTLVSSARTQYGC